MSGGQNRTVQRRQLGMELRKYREAAGYRNEQVAERFEWSGTKLSRMETGQVKVHHGDVRDLLEYYGVTDQEVWERLIALARATGRKNWWHTYDDVLRPWHEGYIGLEDAATSIISYKGQLIHGLLQTADYARAITRSLRMHAPEAEIERLVEVRIGRQSLLTRENPPTFWCVLSEEALRRPVGGSEAMRRQLEHLLEVERLPNVTLQVIQIADGAHPAMDNPFTLLKFPDGATDLAYIETITQSWYLDRPQDVERYTLLMEQLRAQALSPAQSRKLIAAVAKEHP